MKSIFKTTTMALFFGVCFVDICFMGISSAKDLLPVEKEVARVTSFRKTQDTSAMRQWLKETGVEAAVGVLLQIDNQVDPYSKTRLFSLEVLSSLKNEGLSLEQKKAWGQSLEKLSLKILNHGPVRAEYLGQAFLMQGDIEKAVGQYQYLSTFPKGSGERARADWFFREHSEFRKPANQ